MNRAGTIGASFAVLTLICGVAKAQPAATRPAGQRQPPVPPASSAASLPAGPTDQLTVPFSNPSRPGAVRVRLLSGNITVRPSSAQTVIVTSRGLGEARQAQQVQPTDAAGLRRLTQPGGLRVDEENNVITISAGLFGAADVDLQVPAKTNLALNTVNGQTITVDGVEGDLEVNAVNGSIALRDVSGSVVAHATNGNVLVTVKSVAADKPMAFTSLNGTVDVTLPSNVKATFKLRSDQGEVYTDFDVQMQRDAAPSVNDSRTTRGRHRVEVNRALVGTVNGGGPEFELRSFNGNIYLRKAK